MQILEQRRVGITLIEMLVCILIVGVLLGLLLPAVHKARSASTQMLCSQNARTASLLILHYSMDFRDAFPFAGQAESVVQFGDGTSVTIGGVRQYSNGRWAVLFPDNWRGGMFDRSLMCPNQEFCPTFVDVACATPFPYLWMSSAVWSDATTLASASSPYEAIRARPNRLSDVNFPSDKSLFFEQASFCTSSGESLGWAQQLGQSPFSPSTISFCDLSVARYRRDSGQPCVATYPFDLTVNGVRGTDRPYEK